MLKDIRYKVKVVIPIYRSELTRDEEYSLQNSMEKLSAHPIVFLIPEGLDVAKLERQYPQASVMTVSDNWLGTKRGIAGYNEMMMAKEFYDMFADTEFIFICHIDAWIFRDELDRWCDAGYDLVAAPWPTRPYYRWFPFKQLIRLKKQLFYPNRIIRSQMMDRIGNGGLCLRRVKPFREACDIYAEDIKYFNTQDDPLYNEDLFWALIPKNIKYPSVEVALEFSYDLKPELCHWLNKKRLPMACHGYTKRHCIKFWRRYIPYMKSL